MLRNFATSLFAGSLLLTSTLQAQTTGQNSMPSILRPLGHSAQSTPFEGAVYAMSNDFNRNRVVAYGRNFDGTLTLMGDADTGGRGAAFDGGEGLDPLISAYALVLTDDGQHLLAVNAGSDSITVFRINCDFTLTRTDLVDVVGVGPNSIAYRNGIVYVASIDADGVFLGEPDQEGLITGFRLTPEGRLINLPFSTRFLGNRPSAVQFSPDGRFLLVASINAGSAALSSGSVDELVAYRVFPYGNISVNPSARASSTFPGNPQGRNLPSAIGFEVVETEGRQFVVVTEAREFQSDGAPPQFDRLQTGSVSTWELTEGGDLKPINLDVLAGNDFFDGERTACWIEFSKDQSVFWVSNALESTISSFSFYKGEISIIEQVAAEGTPPSDDDPFGTSDGWIDLWLSSDGKTLYQLFGLDGSIGVYSVLGSNLTFIQKISGLPELNTQGVVAL